MNNQGLLSRRTTALSRTVVVVFLVLQVQSPTRGASLGQNDPSEDASQSCGYGVGNFPHIQLTNLMVQAEGSENLLEAAVMVHGCVSGSNYRLKTSVLAVETETKFTHSRSSYEPLQIQIKCADLSVEAQSDSPPLLHFELFGEHPAVSQCSVSLSGLITSASFPLELSGPLLSCKNTAANKGPSVPDQHSKKEIDNSAEQPIEPEKKDRSSRKRKQISSLTEFNFLGPYQPRPDLWMSWWPPAFERVSKRMNHFNIERMQNSVSPDEADDKVYGEGPVRFSLDFPTYVMNLPSRYSLLFIPLPSSWECLCFPSIKISFHTTRTGCETCLQCERVPKVIKIVASTWNEIFLGGRQKRQTESHGEASAGVGIYRYSVPRDYA